MPVIPKPPSCQGCPMFQDGMGYVPDEIVPGARVLVLAQNPGANEENGKRLTGYEYAGRKRIPIEVPHHPAPLLGATGYEMERHYLPLAGLVRGDNLSLANVLKCRLIVNGKRVNDLPKGKVLDQATRHCTRAHLRMPEGVELVVAMGALSADFMGMPKRLNKKGQLVTGSVHEWRGFCLPME